MSRSIRNVVKKYSKPYTIQRFDRKNGSINSDGLYVSEKESLTTVKVHLQPITDQLNDGTPGQRQVISWHGWAVDKSGNEVSNKDILTVDDGFFTVSNMVHWPGEYREFDLTRSGENENLDDT